MKKVPPVDRAESEQLRMLIATSLGLWFEDSRLDFVGEVLRRRLERTRLAPVAYLGRLDRADRADREWRELAQELTVTETYFFRNVAQLRAFTDVALHPRASAPAEPSQPRPLRILCAGCASGEEPYSLAMLAREHLPEALLGGVHIRAVDVNAGMLEKAARARYSAWALRETQADAQARWFAQTARGARGASCDFALAESIRGMVTFEERNLLEEDADFFRPGSFDVVFFRNVLMYFTPEAARGVVARITRSLTPGGYLFLGHAETLRGLSEDYGLLHTHDTFYYRRQPVPEGFGPADAWPATLARIASPVASEAASWVDSIRVSAERIRSLTEMPGGPPGGAADASASGSGSAAAPGHGEVARAIELIREERFDEATAILGALPAETAGDPDVLLLRAVLLTHGGDLARAEDVCADLLELDGSHAGARYLLALCRENAGDRPGATVHAQIAASLDPTFAMPRLKLGLLARRGGDPVTARRELGHALALLSREETSRVLLFGGGFSRDALLALCRAELSSCGGAP